MSKRSKGARLWLKPGYSKDGYESGSVWVIKDGNHRESTGCAAGDREGAEKCLADYIARKYSPERSNSRSPAAIPVADVLMIYGEDKEKGQARPKELWMRIDALAGWWGDKTLAEVNGSNCRAYAASRGSMSAARRELEDLRAAINHHRREGLCSEIIGVWLPEKSMPRLRWLTRQEAAKLLFAAWRAKQSGWKDGGKETRRHTGRHLARFILVGLYTGTRSGAICGASMKHLNGRGYVDLERGIFYRRAEGAKETKKRQPPATLPPRLLAHMRRWNRLGLCEKAVVEWNGKPVKRVNKAFRVAVEAAGISDVTPHTLRHTAATWLMQNGADIWEAAGYLGMTPQVLETVYGHHHPDHQQGAVAAISKRRTQG